MKTKKLTGHSTIMFEINENDFKDSYYYKHISAHSKYYNAFYDFLVSLKVGVTTEDIKHPRNVTIEGVQFEIDISNASKQSKNAFDRTPKDRKPMNRFIRLAHTWMGAPTVIKVQFNKEYDADNLREKIASGVAFIKEREANFRERKDAEETNTVRIAEHYRKLATYSRDMTIERGIISFHLYKIKTRISIDLNGIVTEIHLYGFTCKEKHVEDTAMSQFRLLRQAPEIMYKVLRIISECGVIPHELHQWAKEDAYRMYYNYEEKKYGY